MVTGDKGHDVFTQVRALSMEVKPYSCLINIDDMGSTRVDLPRDQRGQTLEASLWYDCCSSYGLKLSGLYKHQRGLGLNRVGYNGRRSSYRITKLAFHANESPIWTWDGVFNLVSS